MKTNVPNFLIMAVPEKKSRFSVCFRSENRKPLQKSKSY